MRIIKSHKRKGRSYRKWHRLCVTFVCMDIFLLAGLVVSAGFARSELAGQGVAAAAQLQEPEVPEPQSQTEEAETAKSAGPSESESLGDSQTLELESESVQPSSEEETVEQAASSGGAGTKEESSGQSSLTAEWDESHRLDRQLPALTASGLEIPVNGATGYAPVAMTLWTEISAEGAGAGAMAQLEPGDAFLILREEGEWWQVQAEQGTGWVWHGCCMINLPDVIPSIIYDATNSYNSLYRSSGKEIPGVTGQALYPGAAYNLRLDRDEYAMPMLYAAAKKVCAAQQAALAQGNSLKIYEAYRPYFVQQAVIQGLSALAEADPEVAAGVNTSPWHMGYFIATGYSNHQRGIAVDVSLVKVTKTQVRTTGGVEYLQVTDYEEYRMPTQMHELSMAAASTTGPGSRELAAGMNEPAAALRSYFEGAGMSPLESEWWHFNDFAARDRAGSYLSTGNFVIEGTLSRPPER